METLAGVSCFKVQSHAVVSVNALHRVLYMFDETDRGSCCLSEHLLLLAS